jgi:PAS domain S-box-containing protein
MLLQLEGLLGPSEVFRFVEEKLGTGVWLCDAASQMQWSRGLYALLGLEPHDVTPSYAALIRRIHPDDRRRGRIPAEPKLERSLLEGEFRVIRPNGVLRCVHNQTEVLLDAAGQPACLLGVMVDMTERRKSLQSFKLDAERYGALIRVAAGLLWIASSDGRITALPNAEQAQEAHPFFGRGWVDLLPEEDRDSAVKKWVASTETGRPYNVEHRLRQPDGTYRWFRCMAVPVTDTDGGIREWMGISVDVHNEKLVDDAPASRLTGAQIRAARGMLNWSVRDLAERAGISVAIIRRLEEYNDTPPLADDAIAILRNVLSEAGIEFSFPTVGKPGIRPR